MKLDASKYKKISQDGKTTILKHPDGHEIRIVHSKLAKKLKDELGALPFAEGGDVPETQPTPILGSGRKAYAEAGSVGEQVAQAESGNPAAGVQDFPAAPVTNPDPSQIGTQEPGGLMNAIGAEQAATDQKRMDDTLQTDTPAEIPSALPTKPSTTDSVASVAPSAPTPQGPTPHEAAKQEFSDQSAHFDNDVMQGHITPKTYQSLFNNESTPGKIGTLFGLLASGLGSGLAHQQNAVLGMMDQEIQRDLDAQKSSASNVQNYYRLNLQNELQKAQVPLVKAQAAAIPSEIGLRQQQAAETKADALTKMQMYNVTKHYLGTLLNKLPPQQQGAAGAAYNAVDAATKAESSKLGQQYAAPEADASRNAVGGSSLMLKPGSEDEINSMGYMPTGPLASTYPTLVNQYNGARQAEKGLHTVDSVFPSLGKEANFGSWVQGTLPSLSGAATRLGEGYLAGKGAGMGAGAALAAEGGGAALPVMGGLAIAGLTGAALSGKGLDTVQQTRLYNANKSLLMGAVSSSLKGTNVGGEQISDITSANTPEWGDSKQVLETKARNIKDFIKAHTDTGVLRLRGLAE